MGSLEYLAVHASNQLTAHGVISPSEKRVYDQSGIYAWGEDNFIDIVAYDDFHLLRLSYDPDDFSIISGTVSNLETGSVKEVPEEDLRGMAEYMLKIIFDN